MCLCFTLSRNFDDLFDSFLLFLALFLPFLTLTRLYQVFLWFLSSSHLCLCMSLLLCVCLYLFFYFSQHFFIDAFSCFSTRLSVLFMVFWASMSVFLLFFVFFQLLSASVLCFLCFYLSASFSPSLTWFLYVLLCLCDSAPLCLTHFYHLFLSSSLSFCFLERWGNFLFLWDKVDFPSTF